MMHPSQAVASCSYELDERFRIVAVDRAWTLFAEENGAPELVPPGPYGRPIWDYISDATTANLWRVIYEKVLRTGDPVIVPIRCDSPTARRFLELVVSRRPGFGLRVDSTVVRREDRPAVLLFDEDRPRQGMLRMCSWCNRVLLHDDWVDAEVLVAAMRIFEQRTVPEVTHGMCPDCYREITGLLGNP